MLESRGVAMTVVSAFAVARLAAADTAVCDAVVSFYHGKDSGNSGTVDSPWQTIAYALSRVHSGVICLRSEVRVQFWFLVLLERSDPGLCQVHQVSHTLQIGSEHGALTLTAYSPDLDAGLGRPVVSGAAAINGFSSSPGTAILTTKAPPDLTRPSILFAQGRSGWLQRARLPKRGGSAASERARFFDDASTYHWASPLVRPPSKSAPWPEVDKLGFVYNASDAGEISPDLYALDEVQVLHFHSWTAFWSNVSAVIPENKTLLFSSPSISAIGQYETQGGRRFILENVREGLDEEGEWYWDSATGTVSVWPRDSVDPSSFVILAPQVSQLLSIFGAVGVTVTDLEFRHAACGDRTMGYFPSSTAAAIHIQQSSGLHFERVSISDSGSLGWALLDNSSDISIVNCTATNLGGDGIFIPSSTGIRDITVTNCVINNTGLVYLGQPGGITLRGESNVSVTRSTVAFSPYAGIKVGWQTGTDAAHGTIGEVEPWFRVEENKVRPDAHSHKHEY